MRERRLLEGEGTARERTLLEAALDDAPGNDAGRRQTLAALGLSVGVGAAATSAAVSGKIVATTKAASFAGKFASITWAKMLLATAGTAAALGTTALGVQAVRVLVFESAPPSTSTSAQPGPIRSGSGSRASIAVMPAAAAASASAQQAEKSVPQLATTPQDSAAPTTAPAAPPQHPNAAPLSAPAAPPQHPNAAPLSAPSAIVPRDATPRTAVASSVDGSGVSATGTTTVRELAEQVRALDAARATLAAGDPVDCLRQLDNFEQRYPTSSLRPETTVVRVQALLSQGKREQAVQLVREYGRRGDQHVYQQRLRSLVGLSD